MSKETLIFILGALIFFSPYMGFPREYKEWFFVGTGVLLMVIGYRLRRLTFLQSQQGDDGGKRTDVFVESSVTTEKNIHTDDSEEFRQYI